MSKTIAAAWGAQAPLDYAPGERVASSRASWIPRLHRAWARSGVQGSLYRADDAVDSLPLTTSPIQLSNVLAPAQPHVTSATGFRRLQVQCFGFRAQVTVTARRLDTGATTSASASNALLTNAWFEVELSLLAGVAYVLSFELVTTDTNGAIWAMALREPIKIASELP